MATCTQQMRTTDTLRCGTTLHAWACLRLFLGGFHLHTARSQLEAAEEYKEARSKPAYCGLLSGSVSLYSSVSHKTTNV
jgi:hypothetical protein